MKTKQPPREFFVAKNGVPCKLAKLGLDNRPVLVPCGPDDRAAPMGERPYRAKDKANKAIHRTLEAAAAIRASIHKDWEKFAVLLQPGMFTVERRVKP